MTEKAFTLLNNKGIITIPMDNHKRSRHFTDPLPTLEKSIFINIDGLTTEYNKYKEVSLDTSTKLITVNDIHDKFRKIAI